MTMFLPFHMPANERAVMINLHKLLTDSHISAVAIAILLLIFIQITIPTLVGPAQPSCGTLTLLSSCQIKHQKFGRQFKSLCKNTG